MFDAAVELCDVDDDTLAGLLREASAEVNRAQARRLAITAEWDRRQAWAADGAYNGRCWLAANCGLSRREAHSVLHTAEVVASAPVVAAAVEAASLPVAKVEVLASVVTVRTTAAFVRDQEVLLEAVARLSVDDTRKVARWWQRLADADGTEPFERPIGLRCSVAGDGTTHVAGTLDVEGGAIVRSMLDAIADQLWRAERDPDQVEARPVNQNERLRGQALIQMARQAGAAHPTRTGARPLLTVLVDLDTLEGRAGHPAQVDGGGLVTAEAARRLACDADISRLLTGPDGALLQLGRTTRTATADQWRALRLRDRGCTWPGCDRPPGWCQAHHIVWWQNGGRTDLENLTLLCSHHHHRIHDSGWHLERLDDGTLRFTGPGGRTLTRPPPPPPTPLRPSPVSSPLDCAAIRQRARALAA
ncbi:MAG: hypothetical protein AVDCRST_MAG76-2633 [uncultured Acidimicrobiales bacterium]|uniref:HNH nuclease domain-containing protein n=1 Tax=uncultured Acidimicrobiales bacterium TaxID=310071 RepID=A0A6J4INB5_9ACTN|nr:MAG: hypothetical protein AVDCRST_MAG76-2633 [uncultured Acidimicrobiales bacterium]